VFGIVPPLFFLFSYERFLEVGVGVFRVQNQEKNSEIGGALREKGITEGANQSI